MKIGKETYAETTSNFRPRPKKFIEYCHDGYQKNPLSIRTPKK
jgi:hypothetical protein